MIPAWAGPYVGLPYADKGRTRDGADCWGGVRLVLAEVFGLLLPDYGDAYPSAEDRAAVAGAVAAGLAAGWEPVSAPAAGDLLILRIAGRPWHCGILVTADRFLHWPPRATSCIERLDSPQWARRIEGVYRIGRTGE
ncbi:C40 family peptidase [Dyella marensis]|uniref:C40 family peptidase n=1 Tax=Dyella marensis TaxID=500610 RepID=UPI0031D257E5